MTHQTTELLSGDRTGGVISMAESTVPAGWDGTPLHRPDFDETFYVLDGELTIQLGDELVSAGPGALACAPRGTPRAHANPGDRPARYLLFRTPAADYAEAAAAAGPRIGERGDLDRARPLPLERGRINVLLRGEESGDRIALMDNFVGTGGSGPPLHRHDFDELFCVLEGELTFRLGDDLLTKRAGEHAFAARGAVHTFANFSAEQARTLIVCTPAGFERYFGRMAAELAGERVPEWALGPWPEVTKVGPPLGG